MTGGVADQRPGGFVTSLEISASSLATLTFGTHVSAISDPDRRPQTRATPSLNDEANGGVDLERVSRDDLEWSQPIG